MLIKLTDKCSMMCPHCMEDAREEGSMMILNTFKLAVSFGIYIGSNHFVLSGGEPTENELIVKMCEWINSIDCTFTIVSNGMWLKDSHKCDQISQITSLPNYLGMQVYTNRKWYKEYDYVVNHRAEYEKFDKVIVDTDSQIFMQDLGRAKTNPDAQIEVDNNPHFMSCLNTALVAHQASDPMKFGTSMMIHRQFCKPSVDVKGNVHMSESRLCPSVGNVVSDNFPHIWDEMKKFMPCGNCKGYKKFLESVRTDIMSSRKILGIDYYYNLQSK